WMKRERRGLTPAPSPNPQRWCDYGTIVSVRMVSDISVSVIIVSIGIGAGAGAGAGVTSSTGCTSTSSSPPAQAANARTVDAAITEKRERFMYPPPMRVRYWYAAQVLGKTDYRRSRSHMTQY